MTMVLSASRMMKAGEVSKQCKEVMEHKQLLFQLEVQMKANGYRYSKKQAIKKKVAS